MSEIEPENFTDDDSTLLDVDLFLKYNATDRAVARLRSALERNSRSLRLRERLRTIVATRDPKEAARQCLALASLYIEHEDFQTAHDRLLEAKQLNPHINIAPGLNAIKRARRPDLAQQAGLALQENAIARNATLAGDLSAIGLFDVIQVVENSRLTGMLQINSSKQDGRLMFNDGQIVGTESDLLGGIDAFRSLIEVNDGTFEFNRSASPFPVTINSSNNTKLILDSLRELDETKRDE
jgi:Domain of unknown function (DUF4388)